MCYCVFLQTHIQKLKTYRAEPYEYHLVFHSLTADCMLKALQAVPKSTWFLRGTVLPAPQSYGQDVRLRLDIPTSPL